MSEDTWKSLNTLYLHTTSSNTQSNAFYLNSSNVRAASYAPSTVTFQGQNSLEIMRLEPNGDIYVKGLKVENNQQVVEGMQMFLGDQGIKENTALKKIKTMTLAQLLVNIHNDSQEDADTGFHLDMTIEEYIKSLYK